LRIIENNLHLSLDVEIQAPLPLEKKSKTFKPVSNQLLEIVVEEANESIKESVAATRQQRTSDVPMLTTTSPRQTIH